MGLTVIVAIIGLAFGGGVQFLTGGSLGTWVGFIYAFLMFVMVFGTLTQAAVQNRWLFGTDDISIFTGVVGAVGSLITYWVTKITILTVFTKIHASIQNEWVLAIVGSVISDAIIGIVAGILIAIVATVGTMAMLDNTKRH